MFGIEGARGLAVGALGATRRLGERGVVEAGSLAQMFAAGMLGIDWPWQTLAALKALNDLGQLGAAVEIAAIRHGDRPGLIDELGTLTFTEINERSSALACALRDRGMGEDDCVGILCRNHRGFLDITFAAAKLGARVLYLNTDFAGPQLREVCVREQVSLLVHDIEFTPLIGGVRTRHGSLLAWSEIDGEGEGDDVADGSRDRVQTLEQLIASAAGRRPGRPRRQGRVILLTSGTTGVPKGAPRSSGRSLAPVGALLSKVPYRAREAVVIAPPMLHALGYTQMLFSVALGSTTIVRRRFSGPAVLGDIQSHRPSALVAVPVIVRRIVTLLEEDPGAWNTSSLRIVLISGAQLEPDLVRRAQRTLGDVLYNFYGSTEVAYASFATPEDLRAAPGCAGRPPFGTVLRLYDDGGMNVSGAGRVGRIFVGNTFQFDGYTGGGGKTMIDGLMSTGDVGHFDEGGRLFIDGRDDDMVISGGENMFPAEVEELLGRHPAVEEAAVIGVPDEEFGNRLAAFVVRRDGQELSAEEVCEFVRRNLARFKIPRDVVFLDELPRNPSGKVLKRSLAESHFATVADQAQPTSGLSE
jgi:fatty-acyl-CoA synthase